jgi:hypothetical protein
MTMKRYFYGTLAILVLTSSFCFAAPEPAIVQGPDHWTVDVQFEHPQQILVRTAADGKMHRYWYSIVKLTNRTGANVDFYPSAELMTDTFQIIPAGQKIPGGIFERIKARHESKYPFLELLEKSDYRILEGDDNAKSIAIIWPDFDPNAKSIQLFLSGLSNETAVIKHPTKTDDKGQPMSIFLRKTLVLDYALAGDPTFRTDVRLTHKEKKWVMR